MFPNYSFQKNLYFNETNNNFQLNILLNKLRLLKFFKPYKYHKSYNYQLIQNLDSCEITKFKISFLPLDFLRNYIKINYDINIKSENLLEEKKKSIDFLLKKKVLNNEFYKKNFYKNVKLNYFRKPLLKTNLTKTFNFAKIKHKDGIDGFINKFKTENPDLTKIDENEWMYATDLKKIIKRKIVLNDEIHFIPLIYLYYDNDYLYSLLYNNKEIWKTNKRYICFFLLNESHFHSVFIDKNFLFKKNQRYKICFFFNSCGYNENDFKLKENNLFINGSFKIKKQKDIIKKYTNIKNNIDVLKNFLEKELNINIFIFNNFSMQNFNSECGIFSTVFLYLFIELIEKKKDEITLLNIKYIYFNILTLGGDLTFSMYRGLFFITKEDLEKNFLTTNEYLNTPFIYDIKNKKFRDFVEIYKKSLIKILDFFEFLKNDLKKITDINIEKIQQ